MKSTTPTPGPPVIPVDKRRRGVCRFCGDTIERPTLKQTWSHVNQVNDQYHQAVPFPKQEGKNE